MTAEKIVTWSTPVQAAETTLRAIGEELELGSRAKAEALIREHLGHIRDLVRFLQDNPQAGRRP